MAEGTVRNDVVERALTGEVRISLLCMRTSVNCLFFGRGGVCLPVSGAQVHSDMLEEIEDVASSLGLDIDRSDSEIYKISNGIYVHTYNSTVKCSSVSCKRFFQLHHCNVNSPCGVKC